MVWSQTSRQASTLTAFFRFPQTPHLTWLGAEHPRADKVMTPQQAEQLLRDPVMIEEKLDGANLGLSLGDEGIRAQNRGSYLEPPFTGQFARLADWLAQHEDALAAHLQEGQLLFGEWCAARHSLYYDNLPDWFIAFDLYDQREQAFYSRKRRDVLCAELGVTTVPKRYQGQITLGGVVTRLRASKSHFGNCRPEGFVLRSDSADWLRARAKIVQPEFVQHIDQHWSKRPIEWNRLRLCEQ